jgi:methylglyoxal synthase
MPQAYNGPVKYLALIAHDAKKEEMAAFAKRHRDLLARFPLLATGTTGPGSRRPRGFPWRGSSPAL